MKFAGYVVTVFCSLFVSCTPQPKQEKNLKEVNLNLSVSPQTLDPRKAREIFSQTITRHLFEGLMRIGRQDAPELAAAESYAISEDRKTYTFTLKKSSWSNGELVTAHDFVYAWKSVLDPNFPSENAFQLYVIKNGKSAKLGEASLDQVGVRALDDRTLQVELEAPTPYFLELTALPTLYPINRKLDQSNPHWADKPDTIVSNGPFLIKEWKMNDRIYMAKNDLFWDKDQVFLDRIRWIDVAAETEYNMFEKRELDWAGSPISVLPIDALNSLSSKKQLKMKPLSGTYFLRVNTEKAPFGRKEMRKAFASAVDRGAIVKHILLGHQIAATSLVPPNLELSEEPYFADGDLMGARILFELVANSGETVPEITMIHLAGERHRMIAQALQYQWMSAFGIKVRLESLERQVYYSRLSNLDYQIAIGSWLADYNDASNFLDVFKYKNDSTNNTGWENQKYVELLNLAAVEPSTEKRQDTLRAAEEILMDEMPVIPIFYFTMLYVNQDHLEDVALSSMGILDLRWAKLKSEKIQ